MTGETRLGRRQQDTLNSTIAEARGYLCAENGSQES